jgi:AraC-like DNA-binding protein
MSSAALQLRIGGREDTTPQLTVSGVLVRGLLEVAQTRGVAPEELLREAESTGVSRLASERISLDDYQALLERAIELTRDPALALQCGLLASESSFGLMAPLVSHAQSLRHGIGSIIQFAALIGEELRVELRERSDLAQLRCRLHPVIRPAMIEQVVAGLVRMLRMFGCKPGEIRTVRFEYKHPPHYRAYASAFGGAEQFGQLFTGIEFAPAALDRTHMHWQPDLHALMSAEATRVIKQQSRRQTLTERVRAQLLRRRERPPLDMSDAARDLGVSVRTLRRGLQFEGTSYRELTQSMLFESACSMLRDSNQTLQAIAHTLGFSNVSSFHRAFTRWSAVTPRQYRECGGAALEARRSGL